MEGSRSHEISISVASREGLLRRDEWRRRAVAVAAVAVRGDVARRKTACAGVVAVERQWRGWSRLGVAVWRCLAPRCL